MMAFLLDIITFLQISFGLTIKDILKNLLMKVKLCWQLWCRLC
ncbi:hypothetical protein Q1H05_01430 [Francisella tularensis subsp. mediasiatica]|nr:hypothetical protein Q1H05_01430 [Francisella tularensis subsp. mediasiatica]